MPRIPVADLADVRLDPYRNLPRANLTAFSGRFVVEGKWLVERLVASHYDVESVLVDERQLAVVPDTLAVDIPVYVLPHPLVEQLIGFNFHRGILACGQRQPYPTVADIVPQAGPVTLVICIDIHDPTNLGGILRNCAAFGVDGVVIGPNCADPFSRRVLRVSMGTAFKLHIASFPDRPLLVDHLRSECRCESFAMVLADDAEPLPSVQRSERIALLVGNEGHGLPLEVVRQCDRRVTLPMQLNTDSLNAAAATAVFLYHFTRQSWPSRSA